MPIGGGWVSRMIRNISLIDSSLGGNFRRCVLRLRNFVANLLISESCPVPIVEIISIPCL